MLKVIELFAGIGAQTEGLKKAGIKHDVVAIAEIDKYASKAYELLHGKVNNLGDITKIDKLPTADLWTYSFPCTDISLAGKQRGFSKNSHTQSSLLWEVERLLNVAATSHTLPKYLLMENVKALVSKKFIDEFKVWCDYLENLGYKNFYQVLNAKDYGVPQNRERVFLISIKDESASYQFPQKQSLSKKLLDFLESDMGEKYFLSLRRIENFSSLENRNGWIRGVRFKPHFENSPYAYTICTTSGNRATDNFIIVPEKTKIGYKLAEVGDGIYTNRCHQKRGVVQKNAIPTLKTSVADIAVVVNKDELISIRRLTPRESLRLMGWSDDRIDLMINAFSDTRLYKMAGNSIVIDVLISIFMQFT